MKETVSLKQGIVDEFPWLCSDLGLRIVEDDFRPESFGNSFVTLESDFLRVRFVRDRGQVWADIGSVDAPKKWWHLLFVLEVIRGPVPEPTYELEQAASLLREISPKVVENLGPKLKSHRSRTKAQRVCRDYREFEAP